MSIDLKSLSMIVVLAPLIGALISALFAKRIGPCGAHTVTITGIFLSLLASLAIAKLFLIDGLPQVDINWYTWAVSGLDKFHIGFWLDPLTAVMLVTVTSVSLLVHIYSIGYMHEDPGYQRFFCYMSLFTFSMLMLVLGDNFLQLFFGWEAVGVVSYLLIGFWFHKESAAVGSFKAFIVNRVGDFGFILGIATLLNYFGTLDYAPIFKGADQMVGVSIQVFPGFSAPVLTVACLLLFVGAMGKSAQVPLHVWLPESMEGPTPISALIHAATMVTAGIYMVARLSPLFELSQFTLSVILILGATGGLFLGLLALVQNDIKRVIAYSTMSQLGYMMAANGASAFNAAIFHLMTHAFFKALLFLGAGSVILAMHHEQDLRKMGNLRRYLPITYVTFLIGSLALAALPPFSGFYSKDAIIEAVGLSQIPGAHYAYWCLLLGCFVTALYTFRALFLAFHTQERFDAHMREHLHEPRWVVWLPLVLLAIPSMILGGLLVEPMLYAQHDLLGSALYVNPYYDVMHTLAHEWPGVWVAVQDAVYSATFWFSVAGVITAWVCYVWRPAIPGWFEAHGPWLHKILVEKYGFDSLYDWLFVRWGGRACREMYEYADMKMIDDWVVNGSGRGVTRISRMTRVLQSGYLYHYVFVMILGLIAFLTWVLL